MRCAINLYVVRVTVQQLSQMCTAFHSFHCIQFTLDCYFIIDIWGRWMNPEPLDSGRCPHSDFILVLGTALARTAAVSDRIENLLFVMQIAGTWVLFNCMTLL